MQLSPIAFLALDLARERQAEAELRSRYAEALSHESGPGLARRSAARVAAGLSRASAQVARRLDANALEGGSTLA
ncbi:MAG TPA: hypothetical protein VH723_05105 [Candidatus Limnocylindrales bacterium]|jgi:hypothetical protein